MKRFGVFLILGISLAAILAPFALPYDPHALNLSQGLQGPGAGHPFGLDENGQDLFVKVIHGARLSLFVAFFVVGLSGIIGLLVGALAGFAGGFVESALMALADLVLAFPKFLLALALLAMMGASLAHLIFALSFSTWAGFARLVRGEVKQLKKREFVMSAKACGGGAFLQLRKHILPNLFGLLAVHGMFQAAAVLIAESGLSFLGLGVSMDTPSWGSLLGSGRDYIAEAPHLSFFPGLFLFLFLLGLNFLGEALRDYFDPHRKRTSFLSRRQDG